MQLEVIIPLKDRATIQTCVQSLLNSDLDLIITICDGGSSQPDCISALHNLRNFQRVRLHHAAMAGFNKAILLNNGLRNAIADQVLISDADIIWNTETIQKMIALSQNAICSVQHVEESEPTAIASRRNRYTYQLSNINEISQIAILPASADSYTRPGCGLICAPKSTLTELGGYKEFFQGWGWEDQDLLIRAALASIPIHTCGMVIHISHSDLERNQFCDLLPVEQTRDRNIIRSVQDLSIPVQLPDLWTN